MGVIASNWRSFAEKPLRPERSFSALSAHNLLNSGSIKGKSHV